MPPAGGHTPAPHPHTPDPTQLAILQASRATADAVQRLLAVARFGPGAGAPASLGGPAGYGGGPPGMSGPKTSTSPFAAAQQALSERAGVLGRLGFGGASGTVARAANFAGGLQGAGFGGAAALAQRAAVPLAIAGMVASGAEKIAGYAHDRYSTQEQLGRRFVRDFVPGGERAQQFVDAMSGRAAGYEQADISARLRGAEGRSRLDLAGFQLGFNPRAAGASALAAAYRGQSAVAPSVFDRSTALGERAYREEQKILPLKQAEARAEREAAVASRERTAAQGELNRLAQRGNELTRQRSALLSQLDRPGNQSGVSRQEILKRIETTNQELSGNLSLQRSAREGVQGATQREAQARGEREKARVRTELIGRAETLESRADTSASAARRLGGMNAFDRAMGLQAARLIKARGSVDGLPPEYIQAGLGFAPAEVGAIIEKTGANTAEFKAGQREFAADFAGNPSDLRKQAAELRKQAAEKEFSIDAAVSQQIAGSFRGVGRDIGNIIKQGLETMKSEILNTIRIGRNPG